LSPIKIIAVTPAFNERKRIGAVIKAVSRHTHGVVVINDASSDDTAEIARSAGAVVIDLNINKGAGNATRLGCCKAIEMGADVIITIDADGQHNPDEIPKLLQPLIENRAQIVFGGRPRSPSMPFENRFGNRLLSELSSALLGVKVNDTLTGFRAFKTEVFNDIVWQADRYSFVSEMVFRMAKAHVKFVEVPVSTIYHDNKKGMRKRDGIKTLLLLFWWKFTI
jgi:glycosyltransferase involved in cell wall biosynthesis